jgi:ATP-binding cassette subfamily B protein
MSEPPRVKNTRATLARLWGYLRQQRWGLVSAVVLVVISTGLNLLGPYLMGRAIDDAIIPGDMDALLRIVALMLGVHLLASGFVWLQSVIMAGVAQRTVHHLRSDLFRKTQRLPLRFFDQRPHGETMSRLTNDVETISQVLTESTTQIISSVLTATGVVIFMLALEPILALASIASLLIMSVGVNRFVGRRTREGFRAQQKNLGHLNGIIEETITGQRVVKAYHQEARRLEVFAAANQELRQASTRAQTFAGVVAPVMNFINNFSIALVAAVGGWLVIGDRTTVGTVAAFLNFTRQMSQPINQMAQLYNQLQSALAGAERVFELLDEEPEIDAEAAERRAITRGEVRFEDVSFSYDGVTPVLKGVDLHAEPGQLVALVGPTGAGKTTIINLLTRFYEIDGGRILVDGVDLRHIRKEELRRQLGIVLQDSFLFAGSVMENIRYGRLDATDDEVYDAARIANADHFIRHLPEGYQTEMTERGGNVSQGQRQLISIARAVLADPQILILDEATSSVDTRTEKHIQEAMRRLMQGRTSFVIAHRLSTIREADQILVINHGEVVERGTHAELLAHGGFYARLHNSQFKGGDEELARQEELAQIEGQQLVAAREGTGREGPDGPR